MERYTSQEYWESYYSKTSAQAQNIKRIVGSYDPIWDFAVKQVKRKPENIIEIGCYPARYLAYLASKYELKAYGIDFNSDLNKIKESFDSFDIDDYQIYQEDFLNFDPQKKFDVVVSLGFIEHFSNFDQVLDKHVPLLSEDGVLILTVPNLRNLRKIFGYVFDYRNLKAHNLRAMRMKVFKDFAYRNNLEIKKLMYEGGFQYGVHQKLSLVQRILYKPVRLFFKKINPVLARHPSSLYSGSIVGVFTPKNTA